MISRKTYLSVDEDPLPIVADGMIASIGIGDGRMIPVLIVDTRDRPDIDHMVRAHQHLPVGDVETVWGSPTRLKGHVAVFLRFRRPVKCTAAILFDIIKQGILIDVALMAGAFYLQPGRSGDRVSDDIHAPRVLVEVAKGDFNRAWPNLFRLTLVKYFREHGLRRREAAAAAIQAIHQMREITAVRLGARST